MNQFKLARLPLLLAILSMPYSMAGYAANQGAQNSPPPHALEKIPEGRLKQSLMNLPPHVRESVLQRLSSLGIPALDLLLLDVDESGELFYIEEGLVETSEATATQSSAEANSTLPPIDVFDLHSNPGSANTIFLDFDGGVISGKAWGGGTTYESVPYDLDGDPLTFNATERQRIHEIWTRIADDFAAFDVNVTTQAPERFDSNTGWLLFTKDADANGNAMPSQGAGGVAYVGVWGRSNYTYYQPALVYYNRLGSGNAGYMAEAGSHEMGHNFGLSHDGTSSVSYFRGLGSDSEPSSWAPIMGVGYYKNVTQWSRGEYTDANQTQDDIAIISNHLGSSQDVEGDANAPTVLVADDSGFFSATNRELDPSNVESANKGIVQIGDADRFQFIAGAGPAEFTATPAWDAFTRSTRRGANLDIGLRLYDADGAMLIDSAEDIETNLTISTVLAEGLYTLEVYGSAGPYASDYGSQGHYYLSGQITKGVADTTPPDPNPMGFAQAPSSVSPSEITMQALIATDDRGGAVTYQFVCASGSSGCVDSQWQSETQYTLSGLQADSQYCFTVAARDLSGNATVESAVECVITAAEPPPVELPSAPSSLQVSDGQDGTALVSWTDTSVNETSFTVEREKQHKNGRWQSTQVVASTSENVQSIIDQSGDGAFRYRVQANNAAGASAWTAWVEVTVTSSDDGGQKPCRGKKCSG
ncbi:zinc-dependent metalloprotease family protein [Alteromonas facilis]|uniref:zinc-dependent metalloprotease family protein n=1 Tax=Alteromonas facilis TaxID=2048004 RepID=UPI000C29304C|nr:zinc-dependent metalloprotease family protein [Alteromonas facilis]